MTTLESPGEQSPGSPNIPPMWDNQVQALNYALKHPVCMLDMEMGTGKTRVAIDAAFTRHDVRRVLVVCPKAILTEQVWRTNLEKFHHGDRWVCCDQSKGTVQDKQDRIMETLRNTRTGVFGPKVFVVVNYDAVWRKPMGDSILKAGFDMVILDESHRAKAAGSKVSKYLAMLGKRVKYKMCLSGTPMANSPLDVYGQYRFLDPTIFGTNHDRFLQQYAIMGGPERRFIVGYKNQQDLLEGFRSIAFTCKMSDVASRILLPDTLPDIVRGIELPTRDRKTMKAMAKEFMAECGEGFVVANNVLTRLVRMQQITSGFCMTQASPGDPMETTELNCVKMDALVDILGDIDPFERVVVFCVFRHDLDAIGMAATRAGREHAELSGREDTLSKWKNTPGSVLATQIQAGAEGIDLTMAHYAVYFSLPHSLALYNQSRARLYRPGQKSPVAFIHLVASETVDASMYQSLEQKKDIIESIKAGTFDFGFVK